MQLLPSRRCNNTTAPAHCAHPLPDALRAPKAGTAKTLTATNLAIALTEAGQRCLVIDLDLQFGDVALTMGLPPETTIYDLALSGGTLDATKLDDFLATHESGARALLAPSRPDQASTVTVELLREIYSIGRLSYAFVIL